MKKKIHSSRLGYYFGIVMLLLLVAACSSAPQTTDGSEAKEKNDRNAPLYYDFGDVLIPRELDLDVNASFVYRTSGFTAGILAFRSKAELGSMVDFFENNMAKDNWQAVGAFKSPRTLLLFQKENRWCVINITDNQWSTLVEIWVAPFSDIAGSGLLK
ncbi:MAG: hypothetical protein V2I56_01385 [Desulfobacteraceae bacterium]|jgi:hypothetical protein|nr:hypothetical protein [Desulfobacteraceae bacterium]